LEASFAAVEAPGGGVGIVPCAIRSDGWCSIDTPIVGGISHETRAGVTVGAGPLGLAALLVGLACLHPVRSASAEDYPKTGGGADDRAKRPDSFQYYGPNGLWYKWTEGQKLGRDTWIFSTYGNQNSIASW
jgi:hypothetical protein